ncbi:MAG: SDR family oxidoreductase [Proteobacteria bacterium]|nr:SDR family oxidoreductase [Pseudomonadota bacterium]
MSLSVLISGCSSGIGLECALTLSRAGWRVFAGVRNPDDGISLEKESSGNITPLILDISDEHSVKQAVLKLEADLGDRGLNALINNAGIAVQGPLEFVSLRLFEKQMQVNVTGHLCVTQLCLPMLRKAKGRIIFISSESGRFTLPLIGPYTASKYALEALANTFRMELLPSGIRVSLIEPGSVKTNIWTKAEKDGLRLLKDLPEQASHYYKNELRLLALGPKLINKTASPVEHVVKKVVHSLTAKRPKIRYVVGIEARFLLTFYTLVPTRWTDWITVKCLNIMGKFIK